MHVLYGMKNLGLEFDLKKDIEVDITIPIAIAANDKFEYIS